jgi:hypothetical protein
MEEKITLGQIVGNDLEEDFLSFDLTEIQLVLVKLRDTDAIDLAHSELLQQQALRAADIMIEYLGKIIKTVSYLESRFSSAKNKAALEYKAPDGVRTTVEMKKWASENNPEVDEIAIKLARAKGSKSILEKKYDILIKSHHHYKDISTGLKRTILGYSQSGQKSAEGWD